MTRHLTRALALTALAALAACSGGGGTVPSPTGAVGTTAPAATGHATLTFKRLASPAATTSATSAKRRTQEFSHAANSLVIDATQTGAAPYHAVYDVSGAVIGNGVNCSADVSGIYDVCSMQIRLPLGNDTLNVSTNAARDGSGATLGSATLTVTIKDAQDNPIAVTLDGNVASMRLFASDPNPRTGAASNIALIVQLYDATGTVLMSPQNYTQPVVLTDGDTGTGSSLYTQVTQNSTQRYNGTPVASPGPSATAKTVSVPDRYTVPYVAYTGASSTPFSVSAAFGTFNASVTITPVAPAARPAGTTVAAHTLANTVRSYDPIFDSTGKLWITQTGGRIASIETTNYTVTGTYQIGTGGRTLRSPVLGPDGQLYIVSSSVSNGAAVAPYFVTRFDPIAHTFTDIPTTDEVLHPTVAGSAIVGAERNANKVWRLPFSGTSAGTPAEFAVGVPPVTDTTAVLLPLPTRVFPSSDGNLWVVYTSYATVDGTWLAKYTPAGVKVSEARVDSQHPARSLDAQAISPSGSIWYVDLNNLNEFVREDTATGPDALTTYAVPRLYGDNSFNEFTAYAVLDASANLYFISFLDQRIGRVDAATGRTDFFGYNANGQNIYGLTVGPDGTLVMAGYNTGPFLVTLNTK
ncbi:MAG: hypothetical protein QOD51_1675 [Candidatus Eremiobacteraeota bacterium]|nr:hypothetical protein [Candidatus Eremiobacteraeota bacterium]